MKKYIIKNALLKEYVNSNEALGADLKTDGNHYISLEDVDILLTKVALNEESSDVHNCRKIKRQFENGTPVIIKENLLGIVLSSHIWTNEVLYRIIVDASDCMYRVHKNTVDQSSEQYLFDEDYNTLMYSSEQIGVMELFEEDLKLYER